MPRATEPAPPPAGQILIVLRICTPNMILRNRPGKEPHAQFVLSMPADLKEPLRRPRGPRWAGAARHVHRGQQGPRPREEDLQPPRHLRPEG